MKCLIKMFTLTLQYHIIMFMYIFMYLFIFYLSIFVRMNTEHVRKKRRQIISVYIDGMLHAKCR